MVSNRNTRCIYLQCQKNKEVTMILNSHNIEMVETPE